jgi:oxygen-independent coproporphyrinogen-3 oxidase
MQKNSYRIPSTVGIYIHVPFCAQGKCPYCDFYSVLENDTLKQKYINAVERDLQKKSPDARDRTVDTIYFGGGTPSVLGGGLSRLLCCIKENYNVAPNAEITFEANPRGLSLETLALCRKSGFNRLSLGMQSAIPSELALLGRRHTNSDVELAVQNARHAGFDNISLDLMLCVPNQTEQSIKKSVEFAASLVPRHISAYLLKVEKGTHYFDIKDKLNLPDNDAQADMYVFACQELEKHGYMQYEISNFAQKGFESRHNIKYWNCDEYLGFGPAAHSFFNGKRYYYPRSLDDYIKSGVFASDGDGGSLEEYIMLRLRLSAGLYEPDMMLRYGIGFSYFNSDKLYSLEKSGYIKIEKGRLLLTRKGFLMSNSVICELIFQ